MSGFKEIRKLFDVWDDSFGLAEQEIVECEKRLGAKLPATLREYFLQLGGNAEINQTQDILVRAAELEIGDSGFVVFYNENQWVWRAGIKFSDFAAEDPPVYLTYDGRSWNFECDKLSDFLTSIAYLQALFALPCNANRAGVEEEKANFVRENWQKIDSTISIWGIEFYQNDSSEIVALLNDRNQVDIFVAARDAEKLRQISEKLDLDWDYSSLEDE